LWQIRSAIFGDVLIFGGLFNLHVAELLGVKDLATLQALDKFGVIVPGDNSHSGMFAGDRHLSWIAGGPLGWSSFRKIVAGFKGI
jgi:hypothetical protein